MNGVWNNKCGDEDNPHGPQLKANGTPCKHMVTPGSFRCYMHGSRTPAAKMKAELSMALLRMPAIEGLQKTLDTLEKLVDRAMDVTCLHCGHPQTDGDETETLVRTLLTMTKTSQTILDRCGLGPRATLEVKQSDGDFDLRLLTPDLKGRMIAALTEIKAIKEEARLRALNTPIEVSNTKQLGAFKDGETVT